MFSPLMGVSENSSRLKLREFFEIRPRFVARNGDSLAVEPVLRAQPDERLSRLIDRWNLRECVGRLSRDEASGMSTTGFLIPLSNVSCTDERLVKWVDDLFKYYGQKHRLAEICVSISPSIFLRQPKKVLAFCNAMRSEHRFRFVLDGIEDPSLCKTCFGQFPFDMVIVSDRLVDGIARNGRGTEESAQLLNFDIKRGALSIARNIGDSDALHAVILAGIDFVQGDFVAPDQEEVDASKSVETVHLG